MNSNLWFGTSGPRNADVVLVGEAWGREEEMAARPFVGASGKELDRMLSEAGLQRPLCFATNVVAARPPNNEMWRFFEQTKAATAPPLRGLFPSELVRNGIHRLHEQLTTIRPKVVIAVGNYALWALTACCGYSTPAESEGRRVPNGIESWRGSMFFCDAAPEPLTSTRLIPILHPAGILREWSKRAITVHDLRTRTPMALRGDWRPNPPPIVRAPPKFDEARSRLLHWLSKADSGTPFRLVNDIETMPSRGLISCIGFADSAHFAMTIPLVLPLDGGKRLESYWPAAQEHELMALIRRLLMHPGVLVEGQNYLYDIQWLHAFLACLPSPDFDTMLAHHLLFPGTSKGLDYLSSLYCRYHWYWKEDGKEWDLKEQPERLWSYNAIDCLRQFEVGTVLRELIPKMGQAAQWEETKARNALALRMMLRGARIDKSRRAALALDLSVASGQFADWFERVLPQQAVAPEAKTSWFNSPHQQRALFGDQLGLSLPRHRKTGNQTLGKEGLEILRARHPEFTRLFSALKDYRSLKVFHNTFIAAPLDHDDRMRCMFNVAGTETFRWSSSENAFGSGTNLQNIPKGNEDQE